MRSTTYAWNKSARIWRTRAARWRKRAGIHAKDSTVKSNVFLAWMRSAYQKWEKRPNKTVIWWTRLMSFKKALMKMLTAQSAGYLGLVLNLASDSDVDMYSTWIASRLSLKISGLLLESCSASSTARSASSKWSLIIASHSAHNWQQSKPSRKWSKTRQSNVPSSKVLISMSGLRILTITSMANLKSLPCSRCRTTSASSARSLTSAEWKIVVMTSSNCKTSGRKT